MFIINFKFLFHFTVCVFWVSCFTLMHLFSGGSCLIVLNSLPDELSPVSPVIFDRSSDVHVRSMQELTGSNIQELHELWGVEACCVWVMQEYSKVTPTPHHCWGDITTSRVWSCSYFQNEAENEKKVQEATWTRHFYKIFSWQLLSNKIKGKKIVLH